MKYDHCSVKKEIFFFLPVKSDTRITQIRGEKEEEKGPNQDFTVRKLSAEKSKLRKQKRSFSSCCCSSSPSFSVPAGSSSCESAFEVPVGA